MFAEKTIPPPKAICSLFAGTISMSQLLLFSSLSTIFHFIFVKFCFFGNEFTCHKKLLILYTPDYLCTGYLVPGSFMSLSLQVYNPLEQLLSSLKCVHLDTQNNSRTTIRIFMKFDNGNFYEELLRYFNFYLDRATAIIFYMKAKYVSVHILSIIC